MYLTAVFHPRGAIQEKQTWKTEQKEKLKKNNQISWYNLPYENQSGFIEIAFVYFSSVCF